MSLRSLLDSLLGRVRPVPVETAPIDEDAVIAPPPPPPLPPELAKLSAALAPPYRQCFCREEIYRAQQGLPREAPLTGMPRSVVCPGLEELVPLGLVPPPSTPAMSGSNLTSGPFRVEGRCCYDGHHWHTGRPLRVEGEARRAPLARRGDWRAAAWS